MIHSQKVKIPNKSYVLYSFLLFQQSKEQGVWSDAILMYDILCFLFTELCLPTTCRAPYGLTRWAKIFLDGSPLWQPWDEIRWVPVFVFVLLLLILLQHLLLMCVCACACLIQFIGHWKPPFYFHMYQRNKK